jgi:hypothetical protein
MWAGLYGWFEVVRCQDSELERGPGFCPAKPKTARDVLGIGRVWMLLAQVVYRDYGVRRKWWWCWWDARTRKLGGGRGLPCQTENRVHTLARPSKVLGRRLSERVHARVDIVVEVVGCYVGENERPAVN